MEGCERTAAWSQPPPWQPRPCHILPSCLQRLGWSEGDAGERERSKPRLFVDEHPGKVSSRERTRASCSFVGEGSVPFEVTTSVRSQQDR